MFVIGARRVNHTSVDCNLIFCNCLSLLNELIEICAIKEFICNMYDDIVIGKKLFRNCLYKI